MRIRHDVRDAGLARRWGLAAATLLVASGCGEEGASVVALPASPGESDEPLYLIQTRVFAPDSTTGVLIPTPSLDGPLDDARALEQPGGGVLYAQPGIGAFLIGSGEEPTITRYEIDASGGLVPGDVLSFANEGVVYLYAGSVTFVSATQAYYFDLDQLQAIAFDPSAMTITRSISLAAAEREGFFTSFGDPVIRPDGIYFPGHWYTDPDWDRVPVGSMLVRLDPTTDQVTMTSDPRCTGMLESMTTSAGDTYWFSDAFNAFGRTRRGPESGVPDCALRLRAGEDHFDPAWQLDIGSRTGQAPSVAVLQGSDSQMWLRVLDEAAVQLPEGVAYADWDSAQAWQWYLLDVTTDAPAVRSEQRPPSSLSAIGMYVDGRSFTSVESEDLSESVLLELTRDGSFVERTRVRGVIDEIARVR